MSMSEPRHQWHAALRRISRRDLHLVLLALALGCSSQSKESSRQVAPPTTGAAVSAVPATSLADATANTTPSAAPSSPTRGDELALGYPCGQKYEGERCASGSQEYARWLTTTTMRPGTARILRIDGGGPLGAEWNPSNDLVLLVPARDVPVSVRVGSKTIEHAEAAGRGWVAFRVPLRDWKRAERRPSADDGLERTAQFGAVRIVPMVLTRSGSSREVLLLTSYGE